MRGQRKHRYLSDNSNGYSRSAITEIDDESCSRGRIDLREREPRAPGEQQCPSRSSPAPPSLFHNTVTCRKLTDWNSASRYNGYSSLDWSIDWYARTYGCNTGRESISFSRFPSAPAGFLRHDYAHTNAKCTFETDFCVAHFATDWRAEIPSKRPCIRRYNHS